MAAAQSWQEKPIGRIYNPEDAGRIWRVRDSALGATAYVPGEPERWEGWDDAGIPPVNLGTYLRKLTALMAEYGYRSPLYGHYGQGCVHLRINFDSVSYTHLHRHQRSVGNWPPLLGSRIHQLPQWHARRHRTQPSPQVSQPRCIRRTGIL